MFMVDFETEKYEFWLYLTKDALGRAQSIALDVATVERRNLTDEDVSELKEFFKDMGKWEAFVKAGKSLLEDLGFDVKGEKEHEKDFGFEKYDIEFEKKDDRVMVTINLTKAESLRRSKGDTERAGLPIEEISEQLKNVPKWQTLKKAISELKKQL